MDPDPREKIRVAFIINDFRVGGAQRLTADIMRRMDATRFEPVLITLFAIPGAQTMEHLLAEGAARYVLDFKGFLDIASWVGLISLLRRTRPHIVVSSLFFSNTATRILSPLLGYRAIATEHNTYVKKRWWERLFDRLLSHWTCTIIAVSESVKTFTAKQEGIPLSKFTVIENGLDIEAMREKVALRSRNEWKRSIGVEEERPVILSVARLILQKNPGLTIAGFAVFARTHPDYDLVIVGEGPLEMQLKGQTRSLGVENRVHFMGARTDVDAFLGAADIFLSTSRIEGFGLAHAEALAVGVPVVTTRTAGPDRMIREGRNGFFIAADTPESVAGALERVLAADRAQLSSGARAVAEEYDIRTTVRAYESLIEQAVR